MRNLLIFCAAMGALAGCATTPAPIYGAGAQYPRPVSPPPRGPSIYTSAPHAQIHQALLACHGGGGSNIGEVSFGGESMLYTPYINTPAGPLIRDPTETSCLSSGFGWRGGDGGREHTGVDLANSEGGWVFAAADGRVAANGWRNGYGLVLELDHGRGVHTLYAHLNEIDPYLAEGARVNAGQAVARMGMTGNATGVHLHYEVSVDGSRVDPLTYGMPPRPTWVTQPAPEPPQAPITSAVTQTFDPPAPIEERPIVEAPPPASVAAPAPIYTPPPAPSYVAPPYPDAPGSPYDVYRAQQGRSPYDIYNETPTHH